MNHAVLGTQANAGITQTLEESRRVVDENVGDILKETSHYKTAQWKKAGFKSGKYLWRLADGARNMNTGDFATYINPLMATINQTYEVGEFIANNIKVGMQGDGEEAQVKESGDKLSGIGLGSIDLIQKRAIEISSKLNKAYQRFSKDQGETLARAKTTAGQPEEFRS